MCYGDDRNSETYVVNFAGHTFPATSSLSSRDFAVLPKLSTATAGYRDIEVANICLQSDKPQPVPAVKGAPKITVTGTKMTTTACSNFVGNWWMMITYDYVFGE